MRIGFIGLGIMGSRMAANLLKKEYVLHVYNRTRSKAGPLIKLGAEWSDTPAQVAKNSDVLITMLANPEAVRETALGENGFLEHLKPESLWIDCSTVNPLFSKEMSGKAFELDIRFLDAPVLGTKGPAEKGELLFLAGGEPQDLEIARPLFNVMGKKVVHAGKNGMGTAMKMVMNLMLGEAMVAFSEALVLGESLGISRETLFDSLLGGPVAAPFLTGKSSNIAQNQYEADFPLQWMHKDLQLVAETAYENGAALPAANVIKEIFALAERSGLGEQDFSAVYRFLSGQKK